MRGGTVYAHRSGRQVVRAVDVAADLIAKEGRMGGRNVEVCD